MVLEFEVERKGLRWVEGGGAKWGEVECEVELK